MYIYIYIYIYIYAQTRTHPHTSNGCDSSSPASFLYSQVIVSENIFFVHEIFRRRWGPPVLNRPKRSVDEDDEGEGNQDEGSH